MSQFISSAPNPPGAVRPLQVGGTNYYTEKTKASAVASANVQPTYGFKIYENQPAALGERSGHYSVVVQQPDDKRMDAPSLDNVFTPANPETIELTNYFTRTLPNQTRSAKAAIALEKLSLNQLLERYLRGKLQDDAEEVMARYQGATDVEREIASARLQNRYTEMIRHYGTDQRVREAILRDVVAGEPDRAVREAITRQLERESAMGGAGAFPVNPAAPAAAMPFGGGDAAADAAAADEFQGDELARTEDDSWQPADTADLMEEPFANERQRLIQRIRDVQVDINQLEDDLENAQDDEEEADLAGQIMTLEQEMFGLRQRLTELGKVGDDVTTSGDTDGEAAAPDLAPSYAPGNDNLSSRSSFPSRVGGGSVFGEMTQPAPLGGQSRRLTQPIIGHEAPGVPPAARASQDIGGSQAYRSEGGMARRRKPMPFFIPRGSQLDETQGQELVQEAQESVGRPVAQDVGATGYRRPGSILEEGFRRNRERMGRVMERRRRRRGGGSSQAPSSLLSSGNKRGARL